MFQIKKGFKMPKPEMNGHGHGESEMSFLLKKNCFCFGL